MTDEKATIPLTHTWVSKTFLVAFLSSVGGGAGGYIFRDSLADRERSETRVDVLRTYFGVENHLLGKRKQILRFAEAALVEDDPKLTKWVQKEMLVVDGQLEEFAQEQAKLRSAIKKNEAREQALRQALDATESQSVETGPYPPSRQVELKKELADAKAKTEELKAQVPRPPALNPTTMGR